MLDPLISVVAFFSLALAVFGLGRPLLRCLAIAQEDRLSVAAWSLGLGAIAAGMVLLVLGQFGGLYVPVIGLLTLFACFWGLAEIFRDLILAAERRAFPPELSSEDELIEAPWSPPGLWLRRGILIAATIAILAALLGSLALPTAGDGMYRPMEVSKTMLIEHRILPPGPRAPLRFPSPTEMWYLWAMAMDGTRCAQLVRFGLGILLAMATVVLATPIVGRPWAWITGAMALLAPTVTDQLTLPQSQIATAVFATLALAAWWRVVVDKEGPRWCFLASLAAGGASVETRLFLPVALAAMAAWLWSVQHRPSGRRPSGHRPSGRRPSGRRPSGHRPSGRWPSGRRVAFRSAALMVGAILCIAGPWLASAAWYRFASGPTPSLAAGADLGHHGQLACPCCVGDRVRVPWAACLPFELRAVPLGGLALAAVPGLLFTRRLRGLRVLLVAATLYGVLWFLSGRPIELLCLLVPLLGVATVWVWIEMRRFPHWAGRFAAGAFACIVLTMAVAGAARVADRAAVALAARDQEEYLLAKEPTYRAATVVNAMAQDETHLLSDDDHALYFDTRVTRESDYRRWTAYDAEIADPAHLCDVLRARGFTHLLLVEPPVEPPTDKGPTDKRPVDKGPGDTEPVDKEPADRSLSRLVDAQRTTDSTDGPLTLIQYVTRCDASGGVRRYRLVELR